MIGFEIAKEFSERGAVVIICFRTVNQSRLAASKINGRTPALEVDVSDELSVKKFMKDFMNRHRRLTSW